MADVALPSEPVCLQEVRERLEEAWYQGFVSSGEGFNGEYPFDGDVDAAKVDSANENACNAFVSGALDALTKETGEKCSRCEGSGLIGTGVCPECDGTGPVKPRVPTGECKVAMSGPTCMNPDCPPCQTPEYEDEEQIGEVASLEDFQEFTESESSGAEQ